jgi:O-antigen biosynthesis protein
VRVRARCGGQTIIIAGYQIENQADVNPIDIIIPVYRGLAETRACVESVLASANKTEFELVIVNDASPEAGMAELLAELNVSRNITLLTNEKNLGFVATCNRAMALHPDRDVLLLNSDTLVNGNWLDRIVVCAKAGKKIASVTPFSNNATLCSYPKIGASQVMPTGDTLAKLDRSFAEANAETSIEIPTGVGFCMWMNRDALNEVGAFDEAAFGRGYGEENDWCFRASAVGYRHLLCADVFVAHHGEISFAHESGGRKSTAQAIIDARYPDYRAKVADFFERDPARPLRCAVDIARLESSALPRVLMVAHGWGGGTERHVRDLARLIENNCEVILLRPERGNNLSLTWLRAGETFQAFFNAASAFEQLVKFLADLGVSRIHLHHVHGLPIEILTLADRLHVPFEVTLHDYFPITPQYHLSPGATLPDDSAASVKDHAWGLSVAEWRSRFGALLGHAERIISPSRDLADRVLAFFPNLECAIWPHFVLPSTAHRADFKVALIGGLTSEKGLDVLEACAIEAHDKHLPLAFSLLGHTSRPVPQWPFLPIEISGSYRDEDLTRRIELTRPDVFLFPSQIPESFSYTLSSAMATGLPIVASNLGSFKERLTNYAKAILLDWNAPATEWNAALITLASAHTLPRESVSNAAEQAAREVENYRRRYVQPMSSAAAPIVLEPKIKLDVSQFFLKFPPGAELEYSLHDLLVVGVDCGHLDSLNEFRRRIDIADREIANSKAVQADLIAQRDFYAQENDTLHRALNEQRATLEQERDDARRAFEHEQRAFNEIVASTSWKLTGPLRGVVHSAKMAIKRVARLRYTARRLPHQAATASHILREEGAAALYGRVREKLSRNDGFVKPTVALYAPADAIVSLKIPRAISPKFSLVIPVYGQHLLTFSCLKSIAATCAEHDIEVIVMDDCSPTDAATALAKVEGVKSIRNEKNLGFLQTCNRGVEITRGEYVVILNNDIILTEGWLQAMVDVFVQHKNVGMVGAKLIYPDGVLQEAGGIVWRDGSAWNVGRNDDANKPEYNYLREVDYCSGACLMLRREFWNTLDGFDERYMPAYYEDTDLAFRVREAGQRVIYQPRAVVVHFEGRSSGTDVTQGVKQHQVTNQATFAKRWQPVLAKHRVNGMQPQLERDRYTTRRVLVVDACMLTPDHDSGSLRMFEMLGLMAELGCKVTFLADNREYREPYVSQIQALGVEVLFHPFLLPVPEYLENEAAKFDVVMLSRATVACKYVDLVKRYAPRAKLIFDTVDLHFVREERQASLAVNGDGPLLRASAERTRKQELHAMSLADITLVVSPTESKLLATLVPGVKVKIVSNIHENMPGPKPFSERDGILFIGGFRHPPNLDAITWYVENVLPIIRKKVPQLVTTIIGSNAPPSLQKFAANDFVIAGFVEDVTDHFHHAKLSISPLRYGAGVKGKVNLSMQYGMPVVATPVSTEGMYLEDGVNVLVADSAEAFADAVIRLHTDEVLWNRLRQGGLENIERYFSRQCARAALVEMLDL